MMIECCIGVSQATISKELKRNDDSKGRYCPKMAQMFVSCVSLARTSFFFMNEGARVILLH